MPSFFTLNYFHLGMKTFFLSVWSFVGKTQNKTGLKTIFFGLDLSSRIFFNLQNNISIIELALIIIIILILIITLIIIIVIISLDSDIS